MKHYCIAALLLAIATVAQGQNLADVVARQIELKDRESRERTVQFPPAGAVPSAGPAMPAVSTVTPAPPPGSMNPGIEDLQAADIQVIGVYGLNSSLKALICIKASACGIDTAVTVVSGQRIRDWIVVSLTPSSVAFERPLKGGSRGRKERREVFLSSGTTLQQAGMRSGMNDPVLALPR